MATAKDVIDVALSFEGVKEYPANSNKVKFNTDYYGSAVSGSDYPWCCAYVWDVFRIAGASDLFYNGRKTAYCPAVVNWGRAKGLTVPVNSGEYGDLALFDWNKDGVADHIGFILEHNADGSYKTIEGNTAIGNDSNGGEVMKRTRFASQMVTIIRPEYAEEDDDMSYEKFLEYQKRYESEVKQEGVADGLQSEVQAWARKTKISDGNMPQAPLKRWQFWATLKKFYELIISTIGDDCK